MKNYFLIIAFLFNSLILFSQEISIKIVEIKSLDTNTFTNSSFSLKKIEVKGLTNKKKNNYFNYNLDFDILSKENVQLPLSNSGINSYLDLLFSRALSIYSFT